MKVKCPLCNKVFEYMDATTDDPDWVCCCKCFCFFQRDANIEKEATFDEVIRCPLCESEMELIDVVDQHHTEVYRCKVFDDHILYRNVEKEATL